MVLMILGRVVRDSLSEKLMFEEGEGAESHVVIWRRNISGIGNSKHHGSEAEPVSHV